MLIQKSLPLQSCEHPTSLYFFLEISKSYPLSSCRSLDCSRLKQKTARLHFQRQLLQLCQGNSQCFGHACNRPPRRLFSWCIWLRSSTCVVGWVCLAFSYTSPLRCPLLQPCDLGYWLGAWMGFWWMMPQHATEFIDDSCAGNDAFILCLAVLGLLARQFSDKMQFPCCNCASFATPNLSWTRSRCARVVCGHDETLPNLYCNLLAMAPNLLVISSNLIASCS